MGDLVKDYSFKLMDAGYPPIPATKGYWFEQEGKEDCSVKTKRIFKGYDDAAYDRARAVYEKRLDDIAKYGGSISSSHAPRRQSFAIYEEVQEYSCDSTPPSKTWIPGNPGRPGKEPEYEFSGKPGWNAGAQSIASWGAWATAGEHDNNPGLHAYVSTLATYEFTLLPNTVGAVVGLTYETHPTRPQDILFGMQADPNGYRFVRNWGSTQNVDDSSWWFGGVTNSLASDGVPMNCSITILDDSWLLECVHDGNTYSLLFDPVAPPQTLHLGSTLYMGQDTVGNAQFRAPGGVQVRGQLPTMRGQGWAGDFAWQDSDLPAVGGEGGIPRGGNIVLPAVLGNAAMSGLFDAVGLGVLPYVVGDGAAPEPDQVENWGYQMGMVMATVLSDGLMLSGWNARQEDGMLAFCGGIGGTGAYGVQDVGLLAPVETYAFANPMDAPTQVGSVAFADSYFLQQTQLAVALNSQGQVLGIFDVSLLLQAQLEAKADALSTWEFEAELLAYIDSAIRAGGDWGATWTTAAGADYDFDNQVGQVWVLNARTGALSRYVNYSFNSFAQIGGHYFGAAPDGIYLLGGDKDGTEPVMSRVRTGELDLGSKQLKRVSNVYLAVSSEDELDLTVIVGADQYTYKARRADPYSQQQRVDTGKGMRATNYAFELVNSTPYELDGMDINVAQSARRI